MMVAIHQVARNIMTAHVTEFSICLQIESEGNGRSAWRRRIFDRSDKVSFSNSLITKTPIVKRKPSLTEIGKRGLIVKVALI
jgi:hypothetical protein